MDLNYNHEYRVVKDSINAILFYKKYQECFVPGYFQKKIALHNGIIKRRFSCLTGDLYWKAKEVLEEKLPELSKEVH